MSVRDDEINCTLCAMALLSLHYLKQCSLCQANAIGSG
jgi:hypothetical protein